MRFIKKYCGCILDMNGMTRISCGRKGHTKIQLYTLNQIDAKKIRLKNLKPEEIAEIMVYTLTEQDKGK